MSLINDALKRAQHQRKVAEAGYEPPVPGGRSHQITQRSKPMASQTLLLIVAGATALIVLSVVATVYLLRDNPSPAISQDVKVTTAPIAAQKIEPAIKPEVVLSIPAPATASASAPAAALSPEVVVPIVAKPAPVATLPEQSAPAENPPEAPVETATTPLLGSNTPAPEPDAPTAQPIPKPDLQVLVFLDNLRIVGVRYSGVDSKVLMNDRVYRVNDVVERNFGLRLIEVHSDHLLFVDGQGATYTKNL